MYKSVNNFYLCIIRVDVGTLGPISTTTKLHTMRRCAPAATQTGDFVEFFETSNQASTQSSLCSQWKGAISRRVVVGGHSHKFVQNERRV